ncbi:stage III sporulation protein AH [Clostridium estertheticum]|uniref:stage III sporulation protein AH n=1 Tax=Clostridium estertheticum TaxID=238834 RepID=UPI001C0A9495|nr:stage III sporulation protein AH [Clostridium estertheticum]MBU3184889.1 stage III sporulation protein AH [Clostridium estertheticum]MCB2339129.1 stage III sporulation protein AH [Clostridium estertheticum]
MFIDNDPKDNVYKDLIDLAFEVCDTFILVVRESIFFNQNADYLLEELESSLKEVKEQYEWPGIISAGGKPAKIYYYNTDINARTIIKTVTNSLHSWVQPDLPEDLSFIKNGESWLINVSHEFESCIITENKEEIDKITQIKGLNVRL